MLQSNLSLLRQSLSTLEDSEQSEEASKSSSEFYLYSNLTYPSPPNDCNSPLSTTSSQTSGIWSDYSIESTAKPIIGYRWSLLNCDENWMRYICPGLQTIRWKSHCWFQLRGIVDDEKLSFVEIYPCAGRQAVLEVNDSVIREPTRLYVGDIISVMGEYRWEVCKDLAVLAVVYDNDSDIAYSE